MSNNRYLEIDSTYRNRNEPNTSAANFIVNISQTGNKNALTALDPISNQALQLVWNGSFNNSIPSDTVQLVNPFIFLQGSIPNSFFINTANGHLRTEEDFYTGSIISVSDGASTVLRRIISYTFINNGDKGLITIDSTIPDIIMSTLTSGNIISSQDSTTLKPTVFIPMSVSIKNFYINSIITNRTRKEQRTIVLYSDITHLSEIDSFAPSWLPQDDYTISKVQACTGSYIGGIPPSFTAVNTNGRIFQLSTISDNINNVYTGGFLRINGTSGTPPPAPYSVPVPPYNESRRIIRYIALDTTFSTIGGSSFTLTNNSNEVEEQFYIGAFLTTLVSTYEILTYSIYTKSGTIVGVFGAELPGDSILIRTVILNNTFSVLPTILANYQIECYTSDNTVPFNYTGSLVSQSQMVCYEIELINLILPNKTLIVGRGGQVAFYPFVYVKLQNVSGSSSGNTGVIYSNNPNSTKMLFRSPMDDIPNPLLSPFVKIDGDGMVQTVKFKPNDSLHFTVTLPDGSIFQTDEKETVGPLEPNPLAQISALFSLKKL
jgi:hypothetical protein